MEMDELMGLPKMKMTDFLRPENLVLSVVDATTNPEFANIVEWMTETAFLGGLNGMDAEKQAKTLTMICSVVYSLGYRKGRASTPLTLVVTPDEKEEL